MYSWNFAFEAEILLQQFPLSFYLDILAYVNFVVYEKVIDRK